MKVHWKVDSKELTVVKDRSEINETSSLYNNTLFKDFYIFMIHIWNGGTQGYPYKRSWTEL